MRVLRFTVLLAIIALAPAVAWAYTAGTGIKGTPHEFSVAGNKGASTGICARCHTPHYALTTLLLWNRVLSTKEFSWTDPATTAGTPFPKFKGDTYKGPTAKCMSCHDGSVTSKGFDSTGILTGKLDGTHPVAMPYPYLQEANTYNTKTTGGAFVKLEWVSDPMSGTNIRLFNDDGTGNITAGAVAKKSGIECSSCHDPHNKATEDVPFLRAKLSASDTTYICLKCHIK